MRHIIKCFSDKVIESVNASDEYSTKNSPDLQTLRNTRSNNSEYPITD